MTDAIADLLTRIRNASRIGRVELTCPASTMKRALLAVLQESGYVQQIADQTGANGHPELKIKLDPSRGALHAKMISKPGRRVYVGKQEIPRVLNGFGMAVLSTPQGMMTDTDARAKGIGGELICEIW